MRRTTKGQHNIVHQVLGVLVFLVGAALLFEVPVGTIIGIPLMIVALFLGYRRVKGWRCDRCGYFFETA